jgi:hypothetical protein
VRLRGLRIQRHFHIIHNEARTLSASARTFIELLKDTRADLGDLRVAKRARRGT